MSVEDLEPLTPAQRYVWNVAKAEYEAALALDFSALPEARLRIESDHLLTMLGNVLRVFAEHFGEPNAERQRHR